MDNKKDVEISGSSEKETHTIAPEKISVGDTYHFDNEGFSGNVYNTSEKQGFLALEVLVHGRHERTKMLEGTTRTYYVIEGEGTFILENDIHEVKKGDLYVIPAGGEYEYQGNMKLLEVNISPTNEINEEPVEKE